MADAVEAIIDPGQFLPLEFKHNALQDHEEKKVWYSLAIEEKKKEGLRVRDICSL